MFKILNLYGIDIKKLVRGIIYTPRYFIDYFRFILSKNSEFQSIKLTPYLFDFEEKAGNNSGHYYHQDYLIANKIFLKNPKNHLDIGGRIDGFVSCVSIFRSIDVLDIRELENFNPNINFIKMDIINDEPKKKYDSLTCLHTIEHFGLGRYGDPIDFSGHIKGLNNIKKLINKGGTFYFSTPISKNNRIEFNGQRVFSLSYLKELLIKDFEVIEFYYVDDNGNLNQDKIIDYEKTYNLKFGLGIFELIKL